jgi:hypothetical protein
MHQGSSEQFATRPDNLTLTTREVKLIRPIPLSVTREYSRTGSKGRENIKGGAPYA